MNAPIRRDRLAAAEALAGPRFVHLKVHSAYSLLEGALPIPAIAELAEADGMPAVGLCDTGNLFGALEFSEKMASAGVQPIVGCTLQVEFADRRAGGPGLRAGANEAPSLPAGAIALFAASQEGFQNLIKLSSRVYLESPDNEPPHAKAEWLEGASGGLIALTGGPDGPIDRALREDQKELALERLQRLEAIFGDRLYVELQRHGLEHELRCEPMLLELAYARALPIVATNEVYFACADDYEAHDALLCIAEGRYVTEDDRRRLSREHFFKTAEQMAELFADLPEALDNTVDIARRCAWRPVSAGEGASEEDQLAAEAAELRRQAEAGLDTRLAGGVLAPGFTRADYDKRLAYEVEVIAKMKFPGYFLIVADFIKWAKSNGIAVGPGRGSGAGSLVAWALTITDLDPLRFGLLFERFLNPDRVSMPDFDIDFCQDRRDEVIRYVQEKYGKDRVAQIITHGKLQARAVLRDVGRVLQMPYGQVDKLCKLVPNNPANPVTLRQAIDGEPRLQEARDSEPMVARLLEISEKLEGLYRHASTHAAGMVIADRPLDELVPLYRDPKSSFPITQYNFKLVEAAGLVKFDFLGLKTLTVLQKAVELIRRGRGITVDLQSLPLDDKKSYELLARADTAGVFQLEGTGMRESLQRLKPDRFEDIVAMVALYRPGPMDNIPTYINRKHGEEPIDFPHPMLEPILRETYGVIIYQEQVMQIAQVLAGYSLGEADLLRRAMGKKDKAEMAKQQARFVDGAMANGVARSDAVSIFELVDKFAGYGFNKSHAAAYAVVSYHTAYLKANFREEFFAASMALDMANTDKLAMFAAEARKSGIEILPPCVNASDVEFLAEPPAPGKERGAIRYALAALKNIGEAAVATIVAERRRGGPYKDIADFSRRLDSRALNKRAVETLATAGTFDALERSRALVHANADQIVQVASQLRSDRESGQGSLFGDAPAASATAGAQDGLLNMRPVPAWAPMERLQHEFTAIGFYLSGHPLDAYASVLPKLGVQSYVEFEARAAAGATAARLAGMVISSRERKSQKGNKFAFAMLSDASGQYEVVIFSDTLARSRDLLESGMPLLLSVEAELDGEALKMRVQSIERLDAAAAGVQRGLKVVLDGSMARADAGQLEELSRLLKAGGKGEIRLVVPLPDRGQEVELALPGRYEVGPMLSGQLATLPGVLDVVEI